MYEIENYKIEKKKDKWIVADESRYFTIDATTLEVSDDWFCSYETIMRILNVLSADLKLENIE